MHSGSRFSLIDHLERLTRTAIRLRFGQARRSSNVSARSLPRVGYSHGGKGGPPFFGPVEMLKVLLVQAQCNLSDLPPAGSLDLM